MKALITPAIVIAMLGYSILLTLFFNLPLSGLPDYSGTPAFYLRELLGNLRNGIERPQLILKIISLGSILIGATLCLSCYLNKKKMNRLRLIFAGVAFAGSLGCGLSFEAVILPILAGVCFALCVYCWTSYRPTPQNEVNLFHHAFPIMMRNPPCLILSTGLLLLVISQSFGQIFAQEGNIELYVAYPSQVLGRLMFLYALWESGRRYKRYRVALTLAALSSLFSVFDILCIQYLGCELVAADSLSTLYLLYLILDMAALVFMWRSSRQSSGKSTVLQIGLYIVVAYLVSLSLPQATLAFQLPVVIYCNLIVTLGWILFITDLYRTPPQA